MKSFWIVSIPFSTIKRDTSHEGSWHPNVSIPFSTIKSISGCNILSIRLVFQFHLVRLKAERVQLRVSFVEFQFHLVRLKVPREVRLNRRSAVSIPFSTIKREASFRAYIRKPQFQFHLVRLKVTQMKDNVQYARFQFHLVRLKAERADDVRTAFPPFQFHLVRLKELAEEGISPSVHGFNSI